jgi:hypothetical protein
VRYLLALVMLVLLIAPAASQAQIPAKPGLRPIPSPVFSAKLTGPLGRTAPNDPADTLQRRIRPTHWKSGALIGAGTGGLGLGVFALGLCRNSEDPDRTCFGPVLVATAVGTVVGGALGALIGGQVPKNAGGLRRPGR